MALIKCPECGREISGFANVCPNCGHPIKGAPAQLGLEEPKKKSSVLRIIITVVLLIFLSPFLLFAGCVSFSFLIPNSAETQKDTLMVGQRFTNEDVEYEIKSIGWMKQGGDPCFYLEYEATNKSKDAKPIYFLGKLFDPHGKELSSVHIVTLDDFVEQTNGSDVLPGTVVIGRAGFAAMRDSGEYTFLIDGLDYKGSLRFSVKFPERNVSGNIEVTYPTTDGMKTEVFDFETGRVRQSSDTA